METNTSTSRVEAITALVAEIIKDSDYYIYDIYIKPTNNIKIFLDGDNGITINAIAQINRAIRNQIEELNWYPDGDVSIEVSSPGIDEPIKFIRQYKKNVGRNLEIKFNNPEQAELVGKLVEISEDETTLTIEVSDKKKKTTTTHTVNISDIKVAQVEIAF